MAVITISRQFGAGGLTLGKMISERLNYTLYDNEIIQLIAQKAKVSPEWVTSMEKEAGGKWLKVISGLVSKSLVDRILDGQRGYIDEEIYVDILREIIIKLADKGNAVIIERGGQYVLKGRDDVKSILLVAEKMDRYKFIEEHYKTTFKRAMQAVNTDDKRRASLYRKVGKEDFDEPGLYHMVFNTSKVDLGMVCDLVCDLALAVKS
jgi:cytidylate kinase